MTQITVQDGKIVLRDGKVGTGEGCCCEGGFCPPGTQCTIYPFYEVDYCEEVDGQWVVTQSCPPLGVECVPCECLEGFTLTSQEDKEPFPGAGFLVRYITCDHDPIVAPSTECCGESPPGDCFDEVNAVLEVVYETNAGFYEAGWITECANPFP